MMGKGREETFYWRGHTDGKQAMKGHSVSLAIRKMQIKVTKRYHYFYIN